MKNQLFHTNLSVNKIREVFNATFSLDLRSIAVFRICLGLVLIHELFFMLLDYKPYFSDSGLLPVSIWESRILKAGEFSVHHWGNDAYIIGLLIFQILAALCFALGWKTRLATFLTWFLFISLRNRNPYIINSGDAVITVMLFWSMFLPLSRYFSLDSRKAEKPPAETKIYNIATCAAIMQMVLIYVHTALLKDGHHWLMTFRAIDIGLSNAEFAYPLGTWILNFPLLTKTLTVSTLIVEILAPLLILLYALSWANRVLGVFLLIGLHAGIAMTMNVGHFSYVCISCLLMFLPTEFINKLKYLINRGGNPGYLPLAGRYYPLSKPAAYLCGFVLLFVILWNQWKLGQKIWEPLFPRPVQYTARFFAIDQHWRMFAPNPRSIQMTVIPVAETEDGTRWNLLNQEELQSYKDYDFTVYIPRYCRWRKYLGGSYLKSPSQIGVSGYVNYWYSQVKDEIPGKAVKLGWEIIEVRLPDKDTPTSRSLVLSDVPVREK